MCSFSHKHSNWYGVEIPATVMAGLIQNDVYPDIFYSTNLENVNSSLFDVSWWYRCALPEVDTQAPISVLLSLFFFFFFFFFFFSCLC